MENDQVKEVEMEVSPKKQKKKRKKGSWKSFGAGVVITLLAVGGIFYYQYGMVPFVGSGLLNGSVARKANLIQNMIHEEFLQDTENETLEEGIYSGMLQSLGDKYSTYYPAEIYKRQEEDDSGKYRGVGMVMRMDETTGEIQVVECFAGAPAAEAGLQSGDVLLKLDGEELSGKNLEYVSKYIRGGDAEEVVFTVRREDKEWELVVEPGDVEVPVVKHRIIAENYGYIQISQFTDGTSDQFADAYQELLRENVKGLIVDLRSNPGGMLNAVCDTLRQILPEGLIVYTEDKNGERVELTCDGDTPIEIPLLVLVNGDSASASEIFAGAVKDHKAGTLLGTTTFGKGIVQRIFPLSDGSAVKLTVSKYYTPNGINIHGTGIEPDVEVEWKGEKEFISPSQYNTMDEKEWLKEDNQLKKAVDTLKKS